MEVDELRTVLEDHGDDRVLHHLTKLNMTQRLETRSADLITWTRMMRNINFV